MNKKKRFVIFALVAALIMALSLSLFVACNNDQGTGGDKTETVKPTEDLLISNGDFKVLGGTKESYPRAITDWSGAKMYSGGIFPDDVIAGAIPLDPVLYEQFRKKWNDDGTAKIPRGDTQKTLLEALREKYSETEGEYSNPLMIYMPEKGTDLGVKDAEYGPTAYAYTSKSFTLERGKYYKLSVDVMTYNIKGVYKDDVLTNEPGARIYVSSETEAEFFVDTKGEWKTYEFYIEASDVASSSLTLQLGLGKYTSHYTNGLTTGYAFFDNVELTAIEDENGVTAKSVYEDMVALHQSGSESVRTATVKVPNGRFDFDLTNSSPSYSSVPNSWTYVTGNKGSEFTDPAPSTLGLNAVIDASKFAENYEKYGKAYWVKAPGATSPSSVNTAVKLSDIVNTIGFENGTRIGSNIYMISQQLMTAQGIKSNKTITFEKNRVYALSVKVYTYDINGQGMTLLLTGADGKDIAIKGISQNKVERDSDKDGRVDTNSPVIQGGATTGGWQTYTFYIKGNQYKDYSYNMSFWLGTGGTNSNTELLYDAYSSGTDANPNTSAKTYNGNGTFSSGWVFVDDLELEELSDEDAADWTNVKTDQGNEDDLTLDVSGNQSLTDIYVDLKTVNLFENSINFNGSSENDNEYNDLTNGTPTGWKMPESFKEPDDSRPIIDPSFVNVGSVSLATGDPIYDRLGIPHPGTPYDIPSKTALMLQSSKDAYFEMESIDFTVTKNSFYRMSLWVKTENIKSTSGIYVSVMQKDEVKEGEEQTYTAKATFDKINTTDYSEYTNDWRELTVYIRGAADKDVDMHLKVTLGSGNRWSSSTLASGAAFVTNLSMVETNYSTFKSNSSASDAKSIDLYASTTSNFTNGTFNNYDVDKTKGMEGGELLNNAGVPTNWSISDNKLLENNGANEENDGVVGGIIKMKDATHANVPDGLFFEPSEQIKRLFGDNNKFANLYGDPSDPNYASHETLERIGGPYMLALASTKTSKAFGFASDKFTLESNGLYRISFWVKTIDSPKVSVYLSGETGGTSGAGEQAFTLESSGAETVAEWTKFDYYVKVGLTSVSLQLNVWLGYNDKYFDLGDDATTDDYLSKGIVLFDSVTKNTIDEEEYDAAEINDTTKKISFMTDGFDSISSTVESRSELSSPSGWTGSEDEEQDKKNTKAGVIYADDRFLENATELGMTYVKILGPELDKDDIFESITSEDILAYKKEHPDTTKDDNEIRQLLADEKYERMFKSSMMPISELKTHSGERMLIINNTDDSAYFYSTSSTVTLKAESYYRISVWVRTYGVAKDRGAYVELHMGAANESLADKADTDNPRFFKAINTQTFDDNGNVTDDANEWTKLTFYVQTLEDDVTSVKLKLGLGKYYGDEAETLASGFAMFDDVEITTVEKAEYDNAVANPDSFTRVLKVNASPDEGKGEENGTTETPPEHKFNLDYLWWMIPTILLGLATIIVVIVFAVRKLKKPKKAGVVVEPEPSSEIIEEKRSNYDKNKE